MLFIVRIELEDGSEVFVPFKRFHAVLPVERERRAVVTTYGKTPLDSEQAHEALVAVATEVQPAPAAPAAGSAESGFCRASDTKSMAATFRSLVDGSVGADLRGVSY